MTVVGGRDAVALARRAGAVERLPELSCDLGSRLAAQPLGPCRRGLCELFLHSPQLQRWSETSHASLLRNVTTSHAFVSDGHNQASLIERCP